MMEYDDTRLNKEVLKMLDDLSIADKTSRIGPRLNDILRPVYLHTQNNMRTSFRDFTGTLRNSLAYTNYNWSKTDKGVIQASFYLKDVLQPIKRGRYTWHSVDYGRFINYGTKAHSNKKGYSSKKIARLNRNIAKYQEQLKHLNYRLKIAPNQSYFRETTAKIKNTYKKIENTQKKLDKANIPSNVKGIKARNFLTSAWDSEQEKMFNEMTKAINSLLAELGEKNHE